MNAACISRHDCEAVSVAGAFKTHQGHLTFMASGFNGFKGFKGFNGFNSAIQGHTSSTLADARNSANAAWIHGELDCDMILT